MEYFLFDKKYFSISHYFYDYNSNEKDLNAKMSFGNHAIVCSPPALVRKCCQCCHS